MGSGQVIDPDGELNYVDAQGRLTPVAFRGLYMFFFAAPIILYALAKDTLKEIRSGWSDYPMETRVPLAIAVFFTLLTLAVPILASISQWGFVITFLIVARHTKKAGGGIMKLLRKAVGITFYFWISLGILSGIVALFSLFFPVVGILFSLVFSFACYITLAFLAYNSKRIYFTAQVAEGAVAKPFIPQNLA